MKFVFIGILVSSSTILNNWQCSVVTVHGARDDHQTAWTSADDNGNWIEYSLFRRLSVRQLDYVYDTSDSARIYDPSENGIAIEANALLDSLAENRLGLPHVRVHRCTSLHLLGR